MSTYFSPIKVIDNTDLLPEIEPKFSEKVVDFFVYGEGGSTFYSTLSKPDSTKTRKVIVAKICKGDQIKKPIAMATKNIQIRPKHPH